MGGNGKRHQKRERFKWEIGDSEKPDTGHLHGEMNALFRGAVAEVLGEEYLAVAEEDCNGMHFNVNWRAGGDYCSNLCMNLFRRHVVQLNKEGYKGGTKDRSERCAQAQNEPPGRHNKKSWDKFSWPVLSVTTTSALGLERARTFTSPTDLAHTLIQALPEEGRTRLLADAQVLGRQGKVVLTSRAHLEWHLIMGRLRCGLCGLFAKGARGLRMHQMETHGLEYEPAEAEAKAVSETQLIVFAAPAQDRNKWEKRAAEITMQKDAMDRGLECCRRGLMSELRQLVESGWDVHAARDRNGCTALNWAAGEGRLEVCKYLMDELHVDADSLTGKPKRKRHSLHWAARNGHIAVCHHFVVDRGVDPDIPTEDGTTPLHYACMMSHLETARWFADVAKCDVNRLNSFGCNASQWCALAGCVDVIDMLRSRGLDLFILNRNGHSVLHKAAMKGMSAAVEYFTKPKDDGGLGLGLEFMQPDADGFTPISFARSNHFPELSLQLEIYYQGLLAAESGSAEGVEEAAARQASVKMARASQGRWTTDEEDFDDDQLPDLNELVLF